MYNPGPQNFLHLTPCTRGCCRPCKGKENLDPTRPAQVLAAHPVVTRQWTPSETRLGAWVRDLAADGDVERNPGPGRGPDGGGNEHGCSHYTWRYMLVKEGTCSMERSRTLRIRKYHCDLCGAIFLSGQSGVRYIHCNAHNTQHCWGSWLPPTTGGKPEPSFLEFNPFGIML